MVMAKASLLVAVILLLCYSKYSKGDDSSMLLGDVSISPSGIAPVCIGGTLILICNTTGRFLEWSFSLITENEAFPMRYTRTLLSSGPNHLQTFEQVIDSTTFLYSRISNENNLPVVSMLLIHPVREGLDRVVINCTDVIMSHTELAVINVVNEELILSSPITKFVSESLESDGVRVTLEWTQENISDSLYSYDVSVSPHVLVLMLSEGRRFQLKVPYETLYNVSVQAISLCGQRNTTTFIGLYYTSINCQDPTDQVDDSVIVMGYGESGMRGDNVNFICPPGLTLTGPYKSTCMGNGEWEPDLREVECKSNCGQPSPPKNGHIIPYTDTLEGVLVTYICWTVHQEWNSSACTEINTTAICNKNGKWEPNSQDMCSVFSGSRSFEALSQEGKIAVASSVIVFTVASTLFFIIGFLCGHFCQKKRKPAVETVPPAGSEQTQIPYYDDVVLKQPNEQNLELKENVAYGPVR